MSCERVCEAPPGVPGPPHPYCSVSGAPFSKDYYRIPAWRMDPEAARASVASFVDAYVPAVIEAFVDLSYEASVEGLASCPLVTRSLLADVLETLRPDLRRDRVEATVDFLIADRILQPVGEWLGEILDPEGDGVFLVLSYDASDLPGLSYESYQRYVGFIYSLARVKGAPAGSIRLSYEKADRVVRDNPVASYGGVLRMVPRCDF